MLLYFIEKGGRVILAYFLSLVLLFLVSSLYLTETLNSIGSYLIAGIVAMFFPLLIIFKQVKLSFNITSLILMYIFVLVSTFSALKNEQLSLIIVPVFFLILYIVAFMIVPAIKGFNANEKVYKAILYSHLPLLFIPLLFFGMNNDPYRGIFYNPNSFGTIVATVFTVVFAPFLYKIERSFKGDPLQKRVIVTGGLLALLLFLVIASNSRTSALFVIGLVLLGVVLILGLLVKQKNIANLISKGLIFSLIIAITASFTWIFTNFYDYFYENIILKFQEKSARGDVLANRGEVWRTTFQDANLFGNGSEYFTEEIMLGAHNTFISVLGEYGWLPLIFFTLFLIFALLTTFYYTVQANDDPYKYLPFFLTCSFLILSMGEGMLFKLSMLATFFATGHVVQQLKVINQNKKTNFSDKLSRKI